MDLSPSRVIRGLKNLYRREVLRDGPLLEARRFFRENGEARRLDYPLGPESVVVDLGGYRGDFAWAINSRYGSVVHAFEPMPKFAAEAQARFAGNDKVHIHCFGLGAENGAFALSDDGPASSFVDLGKASRHQVCEMRAVNQTLDALGIDHIDLLKVNIEGGEYDVMPALIAGGLFPRIKHLQIQFHTVGDFEHDRDAIRIELEKTHSERWCYRFVWESWSLKD
ncbi:FkbM family methyltransferase [Brevundimonas sp.]|uniref:FkbM family methyltransferase n=1 Tax=Brevundimonas sp. TaxID=1871086 RepID=UPI002D088C08|nr:FkbM family methyltransferase [Brevundimonas sp.]HWQ88280.1 FkbM family methyltransferase [Brevundimonas sp.]